MERRSHYQAASHDRWIKGTLTTYLSPPAPTAVSWLVWEDQLELVFTETQAAIDSCKLLMLQCALDLQAIERRLHGLQQSRRERYLDEAVLIAARLSRRELQVLGLLVQGLNNHTIGEHLGITRGTVKNHMTNIMSKLGVRRREDAIVKAQTLGLV